MSALIVAPIVRCVDAAQPGEGKSTIKLISVGEGNSESNVRQADAISEDPPAPRADQIPELFPATIPPQQMEQQTAESPQIESFAPYQNQTFPDEYSAGPPGGGAPATPTDSFFDRLKWLGLRHSSADGRNAGMGVPLVGTSWMNRPYYFGVDLGTVWVLDRVQSDVTRDVDMYGGIFAGCDWDYYWGSELDIQRATPELINEKVPDASRGDRMMIWSANMMYYPWGDSLYRPYWRLGVGSMNIDYPTDAGTRRDEELWNFPIAIGIKYPVRRWLALRAELADQIGLGNSGVATQHDLTLTFALEWRFGAHPKSYWPWNPSRHIW
ncbi:MAG TPA: hypothetical protein VHU84_03270 [Lacipirellulaceae bacterium]|nr:hypothetical protein [Lacipirellulaceae bacterium]